MNNEVFLRLTKQRHPRVTRRKTERQRERGGEGAVGLHMILIWSSFTQIRALLKLQVWSKRDTCWFWTRSQTSPKHIPPHCFEKIKNRLVRHTEQISPTDRTRNLENGDATSSSHSKPLWCFILCRESIYLFKYTVTFYCPDSLPAPLLLEAVKIREGRYEILMFFRLGSGVNCAKMHN